MTLTGRITQLPELCKRIRNKNWILQENEEGPYLKQSTLDAVMGYSLLRKKVIWLLLLGVFLAGITAGIWLYLPHKVDVRLEGVKYRLGTENISEVESATIHIEGTIRRTLKGHRQFQGTLELAGEPMPVPKEQMTNRTFTARKGGGFLLVYQWFEEGTIESFSLGTLYANDDFRQITLTLFEHQEDSQSWHWRGGDGLMLTAPAKDRTEAIHLTNELMAHSLKGLLPLN